MGGGNNSGTGADAQRKKIGIFMNRMVSEKNYARGEADTMATQKGSHRCTRFQPTGLKGINCTMSLSTFTPLVSCTTSDPTTPVIPAETNSLFDCVTASTGIQRFCPEFGFGLALRLNPPNAKFSRTCFDPLVLS
jgi:hypothetical protein